MKTVIVFGPQGCGKSAQSTQLMSHFGASGVVDGWEPGQRLQPGHLHLTHLPPAASVPGAIVCAFADLVERGVVRDMRPSDVGAAVA